MTPWEIEIFEETKRTRRSRRQCAGKGAQGKKGQIFIIERLPAEVVFD
jgi:hypothetical protein